MCFNLEKGSRGGSGSKKIHWAGVTCCLSATVACWGWKLSDLWESFTQPFFFNTFSPPRYPHTHATSLSNTYRSLHSLYTHGVRTGGEYFSEHLLRFSTFFSLNTFVLQTLLVVSSQKVKKNWMFNFCLSSLWSFYQIGSWRLPGRCTPWWTRRIRALSETGSITWKPTGT